jgi:hypothetical protein
MDIGKRLIIPSRAVEPNFKVLLFPYRHGEKLPKTTWNEGRTKLVVEWSDQTDEITFAETESGRTMVTVVRDGKTIVNVN